MRDFPWVAILSYGLLAAAVLACLWLIGFASLQFFWGRELAGAVIAIVAIVVGLQLAEQRSRNAASSPVEPTESSSKDTPPPMQESAEPDPLLSMREQQVLVLLAQGQSNKQMARALSVSENTIKTHLAKVYGKLGVRKRTEALALAHRRGLLQPPLPTN